MRMTKGKMKRKREGGGTNKEEEEPKEIKIKKNIISDKIK